MIRYQFFPRSRGVTDEIQKVIDCFKVVECEIDSTTNNLVSNDVLAKVRPFWKNKIIELRLAKP